MAELAASAFAALASSGTAAAAGAAGTAAGLVSPIGTTLAVSAGTAGSAAAASSGLLSGISTALSVGSAVSALISGAAAYGQSQTQSAVSEINAGQARLEAREKALRIRRELVQKVGAARVAFAGSGLDISSAQAIEAGYGREADFETSIARAGGEIGYASGRMAASSYRTRGYASLADAAGKFAGTIADQKISIARRG